MMQAMALPWVDASASSSAQAADGTHRTQTTHSNALFTGCTALIALCGAVAFFFSRRWPLVGDSALMHYVVFLMGKGLAPYKDIVDVNLPGSYFAESAGMRLFGWGAASWRIYDACLLLVLCGAAVVFTGKQWRAGLFASGLFALIHLQDGLEQAGQRDLLIAVLLLAALACLAVWHERPYRGVPLVACSLLIGATATVKPLFLPLGVLLLILSARSVRRRGISFAKHLTVNVFALLLPSTAALLWLQHKGSLPAFLATVTSLVRYHAQLGHRPTSYLLVHAFSPVLPLVPVWLVLLVTPWRRPGFLQSTLVLSVLIALVAYMIQGKGYPYQRYPLLALFCVSLGAELAEALQRQGKLRLLAGATLCYACVIFAPLAVWRVHSFEGDRPFEQALTADLNRLNPRWVNDVQCFDTFGGCINTMYDMRLVQATGYLYDCYLFTPGHDKAAELYRENFWAAYARTRPRLLVMTSQFCFGGNSFDKLANWPRFQQELDRSYRKAADWRPERPEHWWSRREWPPAYRIYVRR